MVRKYFLHPILINGEVVTAVWFDNDYSGFHLTPTKTIPAFRSAAEATALAMELGAKMPIDSIELLDVDTCAAWIAKPVARGVNCSDFLYLYNAAGDFRNSLANANLDLGDKTHLKITEKLFWGCNLPSMTPPGKSWTPVWTKKELKELRIMMRESVNIFQKHLSLEGTN